MSEELPRRGVDNPNVVDLITSSAERGEVVLVMLEERPWSGGRQQISEVQAKFNAYLAYATSGALARDYPDYAGHRVIIELDCVEAPEGEAARFLEAVRNFAAEDDIRFVVNVDPEVTTALPARVEPPGA